ncbi:MAG: hypothetical protein IJH55_05580 [Romboutsia sp.]|nr:hypothetical protein [Romboutsia sp.]
MSDPKFLNLDKGDIVKYTFRLDEILLDKYKELANLTNNNINQTMINALESYMNGKTVFNYYLDTVKSFYLYIPINLVMKDYITKSSYDDIMDLKSNNKKSDFKELARLMGYQYEETLEEAVMNYSTHGVKYENIPKDDFYKKYTITPLDTVELYKVYRMPNNLDKWEKQFNSYSSYYRFGDNTAHSGVELVIIPEIAKYTEDFTKCLYCFYFEMIDNGLTVISMEFIEALELIEEAGNDELLKISKKMYEELSEAPSEWVIDVLAEVYNTGNIIKFNSIETEEVRPLKILTPKPNEVIVSYHDKQLLKKVDKLEDENKELKEELARLKESMKNNLDTLLKNPEVRKLLD